MLCFLSGFRRYLLQIIRQQVANIENTCHKAGGEKVKAVQNTKKQCKNKPDMRAELIFCRFLWLQDPVQHQKSQKEKGQIIYEHDLPVCLEKAVGTQIKKSAHKSGKAGKAFSVKPKIKKPCSEKNFQYGIALDEVFHCNSWEKVGDQHIRAHKSIIGKGKKVGSASKSGKIREKLSSSVEIFTHVIGDGDVLGIPVCLRTKPGSGWNQLPDQNPSCRQKQQEGKQVSPSEFLRFVVKAHNKSFLLRKPKP